MAFNGRTRLLTLGLSAIVAVGVMGAGVAIAQDGGEGTAREDSARHPVAGMRLLKGMLGSIFEHSGLERGVFKQGFEDGKSITQILEENGVDPGEVQGAVLVDLDAKLDELVASDTISQEQADRIYAAGEQHLPALMDRVPDPDRPHKRPGVKLLHGIKNLLGSAAEALGIEPRDLGARLRAGETVAEIAAEQGVPVEAVIDAMLADANAKLDEAVASGVVDETQAEEIGARLEGRIERFVTEGHAGRE